MAPPQRQRFNAKARGSVAGGSHKKKKRVKNVEGDSNAVEMVPKTVEQKELDRVERIRQEVRGNRIGQENANGILISSRRRLAQR
jgi:hypothetical protein